MSCTGEDCVLSVVDRGHKWAVLVRTVCFVLLTGDISELYR